MHAEARARASVFLAAMLQANRIALQADLKQRALQIHQQELEFLFP